MSKWNKLTSEIYCFADDLGKVLNDDLTKVQVNEALALVGLDRASIEPEMKEVGYWVGWAAKSAFQKTLGIDPDDSQSPWPAHSNNGGGE